MQHAPRERPRLALPALAVLAAIAGRPHAAAGQAAAAVSGSGVSASVQLPVVAGFGTSAVPAAVGPYGSWNFGWGPPPVPAPYVPEPGEPGWNAPVEVVDPVVIDGRRVGEVPFRPRPAAMPRPAAPPAPWNPAVVEDGRRRDPVRARQLATYGDRNLRAGDLKRAAMRYNQALAADPFDAGLHVRLSQVALARGNYAEAVRCLDDARTADPRWLDRPPDIRSLHTEPARFRDRMAAIEARVQAFPEDRDAWLMLGAMLLMSGHAAPASDVFLRLTDEPPSPLLTTLIESARAEALAPAGEGERAHAAGPAIPAPPPLIAAPRS